MFNNNKILQIFLFVLITIISIGLIVYFIYFNKDKNNNISKSKIGLRDISNTKIYNHDETIPSIPGNYSKYLKPNEEPSLTDPFTYTITKDGCLLNSISNLPPNKVVVMIFKDFFMKLQVNNDGILYFNETSTPLPVGIMDDIPNIFIGFNQDIKANTILSYEGTPKYNNKSPYNMPIGNYTYVDTYTMPYKMTINSTGVCQSCYGPDKTLIANKTFQENFNLVMNGKTNFYPTDSQKNSDICSKLCPATN